MTVMVHNQASTVSMPATLDDLQFVDGNGQPDEHGDVAVLATSGDGRVALQLSRVRQLEFMHRILGDSISGYSIWLRDDQLETVFRIYFWRYEKTDANDSFHQLFMDLMTKYGTTSGLLIQTPLTVQRVRLFFRGIATESSPASAPSKGLEAPKCIQRLVLLFHTCRVTVQHLGVSPTGDRPDIRPRHALEQRRAWQRSAGRHGTCPWSRLRPWRTVGRCPALSRGTPSVLSSRSPKDPGSSLASCPGSTSVIPELQGRVARPGPSIPCRG